MRSPVCVCVYFRFALLFDMLGFIHVVSFDKVIIHHVIIICLYANVCVCVHAFLFDLIFIFYAPLRAEAFATLKRLEMFFQQKEEMKTPEQENMLLLRLYRMIY